MAHLFWSKIASIAAITTFAVVAAAGGVEVTRLALGENRSPVSSSASAPLIAHLSRGVTVSIAAISDNDDPQTIWQADGSRAGAQEWQISPNARFPAKPHSKRVILNIQGDGTGEPPVLTEFRFDGSPGADNGLVLQPTAGKSIVGLTGLLKSFPLDHDTATIWLSAGVGKFSPVMPAPMKMSWGNADGTSYSGHTPWGPYVIGKPFLRNGVVAVTISSTLGNSPLQTQWVAQTIDNGQVVRHVGHIVDGTSSDALAQEIFAFDFADPKAITSIGLETRPVEWAQFENVSLRMNSLTHVKVSTSPLKAEKN